MQEEEFGEMNQRVHTMTLSQLLAMRDFERRSSTITKGKSDNDDKEPSVLKGLHRRLKKGYRWNGCRDFVS